MKCTFLLATIGFTHLLLLFVSFIDEKLAEIKVNVVNKTAFQRFLVVYLLALKVYCKDQHALVLNYQ